MNPMLRIPLAFGLAAAALTATAGLPKVTPPATPKYSESTYRISVEVNATSPVPGAVMLKATYWSGRRSEYNCFYLVRGTREQVLAKQFEPDDILQMSCTRHYVRNTPADVYSP